MFQESFLTIKITFLFPFFMCYYGGSAAKKSYIV